MLGVVNEVLARPCAAASLGTGRADRQAAELAIHYARVAMTQTLKRMTLDYFGNGLALEELGAGEHRPAPPR
jgi:hypothetical protein